MLSNTEIAKIQRKLKDESDDMPLVFGVLGDTSRYKIFRLLMEYRDLCVTDVAKILDISPSAVSQHFRILEMADLVEKERMGQMICYMLNRKNPLVLSFVKFLS